MEKPRVLEKILFVDDEVKVLQAYKRALRKVFPIDTAEGGRQALELVESNGPYAVVVSDMRMPGMNGVEFLAAMKECAPSTVRMMLTGNSDQQTAIDAVNEGDIFRFLNKPCAPEDVARALAAGINQHRLLSAEKELLELTLCGSIEVLADVLSLVNPKIFGRTARLKRHMRNVAKTMGLQDVWQLETTAMLSQIGCVILTEEVLDKCARGEALSVEESKHYQQHPAVGAKLLAKIPRIEEIARSVEYQEQCFDGSGVPGDGTSGKDIPLAARLLKPILDYDRFESTGVSSGDAIMCLKRQAHCYDPAVLEALEKVIDEQPVLATRMVLIRQLCDGMIVAENILNDRGILLVGKGQETTSSVRERLTNFWQNGSIPELVRVSIPDA